MLIPLYACIENDSSINIWAGLRRYVYIRFDTFIPNGWSGIVTNTNENVRKGIDVLGHGIDSNSHIDSVVVINNSGSEQVIKHNTVIAYVYVTKD